MTKIETETSLSGNILVATLQDSGKLGAGQSGLEQLSSLRVLRKQDDFVDSTPLASKVHCSINGLENSSSPKYSKVQHLFEITVGLFSFGVGLFSLQ